MITSEAPDDAPASGPAAPRASTGLTPDRIVRWAGWLVPMAVFVWFYDVRMLGITRAFPIMRGDWAMYVAAPNFVRDAPWLSFPVGRLPEYMAPVGTWLGQTDSWPVLYPVYRTLALVIPHRPFQLIGWELLGSILATFGIVRRYLRQEMLLDSADALRAELVATAGAVVLIAQPYYLLRAGHPALFQMWVIPWALIAVARLLQQRRGATVRVSVAAYLAPFAAATALNPYLALMLLPCMCLPVALTARGRVRDSAIRIAGVLVVFVAVSYSLGFVGTGGRSRSEGFGLFMADVALLVDGGNLSRVWPNFAPNLTYEGYGFPGTGLFVCVVAVAVALVVTRPSGRDSGPGPWLWPLWTGVGVALLWGMLPVFRVFDHAVLDLNDELEPLSRLTSSVRSNGRLVWPFLWALGLFTVRYVATRRRTAVHVALALAAVVQVVDAVKPVILTADDRYGPAMAIVREAAATGITRVEFQPPSIWTDCPADEWGPFEHIAQMATAAAVEGLSVNSGYPARGDDRFANDICRAQAASYLAGELEPDVLYVIPAGAEPVSSDLTCRVTELNASVCRVAGG